MHILIAIPTHSGRVESECLLAIFRLQDHFRHRRPEIRLSLSCVVGLTTEVARNIAVARLLADATSTHLLFVDDDMGFDPSVIEKLIDEDQAITAVIYPGRNFDLRAALKAASAGVPAEQVMSASATYVATGLIVAPDGKFEPNERGFVRVRGAGTGIMLIKRHVFTEIGADADLWRPVGDRRYSAHGFQVPVLDAFAPVQDDDGLWLSEDLSFCRRWTNLDGEIWALIDAEVAHVGRMVVKGTYRHQLDYFASVRP